MSRITLCKNVECEVRDECFRFTAQPVNREGSTYSLFSGCSTPCEHFIDQNEIVTEDEIIGSRRIYDQLLRIVKGEEK